MTQVLGHQPVNHRDQSLIPGQSMLDMWWMNWHCERFPRTSVFAPITIIPPVLHTHSFIYYRHYVILALDSTVK